MAKLPASVRPVVRPAVRSSPAAVATLLAPPALRHEIDARLALHVRLAHCESARELVELARAGQVAAVVISLRDASGQPVLPLLGALRGAAPMLPIIGVVEIRSAGSIDLAAAVRAGVHALVSPEHGDAWEVVRQHIDACGHGRVRVLLDALAPRVSDDAIPLLQALLAHVVEGGIAAPHAIIQAPPRTTSRRFARAGLPPPAVTLRWMQLVVAADRLRDRTVTVERAALDAGFSSTSTFRRALSRLAGMRAPELRLPGGFEALIHRFAAACAEAGERVSGRAGRGGGEIRERRPSPRAATAAARRCRRGGARRDGSVPRDHPGQPSRRPVRCSMYARSTAFMRD